jgi:hypothetical protein
VGIDLNSISSTGDFIHPQGSCLIFTETVLTHVLHPSRRIPDCRLKTYSRKVLWKMRYAQNIAFKRLVRYTCTLVYVRRASRYEWRKHGTGTREKKMVNDCVTKRTERKTLCTLISLVSSYILWYRSSSTSRGVCRKTIVYYEIHGTRFAPLPSKRPYNHKSLYVRCRDKRNCAQYVSLGTRRRRRVASVCILN